MIIILWLIIAIIIEILKLPSGKYTVVKLVTESHFYEIK